MHWQLKSEPRCWARVYFECTNVLFTGACIWLSILKFLSADPFTYVNGGACRSGVDYDDKAYRFIGISLVVGWSIFVLLQTCANTIVHVIMAYRVYREVSSVKWIVKSKWHIISITCRYFFYGRNDELSWFLWFRIYHVTHAYPHYRYDYSTFIFTIKTQ